MPTNHDRKLERTESDPKYPDVATSRELAALRDGADDEHRSTRRLHDAVLDHDLKVEAEAEAEAECGLNESSWWRKRGLDPRLGDCETE